MDRQRPDPDAKNELIADMAFPIYGIDLSQEFELQRQNTTPIALNVRGYEPMTQRDRGGSRNGISKWIPPLVDPTVGAMQIQDLNTLVTTNESELLTSFGFSLSNSGGYTQNPNNDQFWVPTYGSGVMLSNNVGAPQPGGAGYAGNTTGSGSGPFTATLIGGAHVTVKSLSGTGSLKSGVGFLAALVMGGYYFQPPLFAS